jgi:uncharacterized protein
MVHFCRAGRVDLRDCPETATRLILPSDPLFYIVASLAIFLVGIAKGGFSGLGAASMPLLTLVIDPVRGAAILLPILIVQDVVGVWAFRKSWDRRLILTMLPGAVIGIFLGWWFASMVSVDGVKAMVGMIALLFGVNQLMVRSGAGIKLAGRFPDWFGSLFGGLSGFTSQIAHAGGPPFQIWALSKSLPREIFAGTSSVFFFVVNWAKVPAYFALGQFTPQNLTLAALFLPLAIASTLSGVWLVRRVSADRFYLIVYVLMIIIGLYLIIGALA